MWSQYSVVGGGVNGLRPTNDLLSAGPWEGFPTTPPLTLPAHLGSKVRWRCLAFHSQRTCVRRRSFAPSVRRCPPRDGLRAVHPFLSFIRNITLSAPLLDPDDCDTLTNVILPALPYIRPCAGSTCRTRLRRPRAPPAYPRVPCRPSARWGAAYQDELIAILQ